MNMREIMNRAEHTRRPLVEANRIGSAVTLAEIPAKYKHLPVLGRGATTIALGLDDNHVLLFTRDTMKMEWLREEGLAEIIDRYDSSNHISGMHELPIMILKATKLEPLSPANRRTATKLCKELDSVRFKNLWGKSKEQVFQSVYEHFGNDEQHVLYRLMNFLANYSSSQYDFDLGVRNFMQTKTGELIVLDPIACSEIIALIKRAANARGQERAAREYGGGYNYDQQYDRPY